MRAPLILLVVQIVACASAAAQSGAPASRSAPLVKIALPPEERIYHSVFPGGLEGVEDSITPAALRAYREAAGKKPVWVYFSHEWYNGRAFPRATAEWIRASGSVPYIRLMLRSRADKAMQERGVKPARWTPGYPLEAINRGRYDRDLRAWFEAARAFGSPLIVEYGTEMNGWWFPWHAEWNAADPRRKETGAARFRDAYRRLVRLSREAGATNITWVFHMNGGDYPRAPWNDPVAYYPGNEWVDWIAVSVYGALRADWEWVGFRAGMDAACRRVAERFRGRPLIVAELGVTGSHASGATQAAWADSALADLVPRRRWPDVIGFSWWNEGWSNPDGTHTNLRVQDHPATAAVFQARVARDPRVLADAVPAPGARPPDRIRCNPEG